TRPSRRRRSAPKARRIEIEPKNPTLNLRSRLAHAPSDLPHVSGVPLERGDQRRLKQSILLRHDDRLDGWARLLTRIRRAREHPRRLRSPACLSRLLPHEDRPSHFGREIAQSNELIRKGPCRRDEQRLLELAHIGGPRPKKERFDGVCGEHRSPLPREHRPR